MKITDPAVLKILKRANSEELWEYVDSYPEDERDDKTDMELVMDELEYLLWMYEEEGSIQYDNLELSKKIMKDTDNGKSVPVDVPSFRLKYSPNEIGDARATVNEYRRLKKLIKELQK